MSHKLKTLANAGARRAANALSHKQALERIAAKDIPVATFIDAGAARGAWSLMAEKFWPNAQFHLLEAKDVWRKDLEKLAARKNNYSYTLKAVSDEPGVIYFPEGGDAYAGAAFKDASARGDLIEAPATSIDHETATLSFEGPYAIKLDTHGTEVDILEGAKTTLANTSLICIETYNFFGQKRFPEMILHLQSLGFRCVDMAEPMFRPVDAALWQLDFYFLRADHPVFETYSFS